MISIERVLQLLIYLAALVGVAPLFSYLAPGTQILFVVALIAGVICDRRQRYWLKPMPATLLGFVFLIVTLLQISRVELVLPVANLLVLLLGIRLLSEKQGRHVLQIFVLATFSLAASTLVSLSLFFFVYLIILVLLVTFGLVILCFHGAEPGLLLSRKEWRLLLTSGLLLPVGSLLLMLVFFVLLPRTEHPLWNFLNTPSRASVGFSDEVRPGSVAELSTVQQTALRVEVEPLPASQLYWRGVVLNRTDGRVWKRVGHAPRDQFSARNAETVEQTIILEAKSDRFLPVLDTPQGIRGVKSARDGDGVFAARSKLRKQNQYQVFSVPGGSLQLVNRARRAYYLQLPDTISPRLREIARQVRQAGAGADSRIAALENFFLARELRYSATQLPPTDSPVDTFLFESRRGYCEYFASSFALLLRLADVPARLVGGYLGGEYNDLGGYYLVGEDLAHVWVEALDDSGHWRRIDPSRFAVNAAEVLGRRGLVDRLSLRILFDTLDYYWTRAVISYDFAAQFRLLRDAGQRLQGLGRLETSGTLRVLLPLGLILFVFWGILLVSKRPSRKERLLRDFFAQVEKRFGPTERAVGGLFELARRTGDPLCREFADYYGRIVYCDRTLSTRDFRHLRQIVRKLAER